jgi:putative DNA primase/helicase
VVILPDNDDEGRKHAGTVAAAARGAGAASVKLVELPDLPPKGDVSDWLAAGHTIDELRALIAEAPEWKPSTEERAADTKAAPPLDLSDDGLALALGVEWADQARHVALWGKWLFWTGARWETDEKLLHLTRTRDFLRRRGAELIRKAKEEDRKAAEEAAKGLRSAQKVAHVVGLARSNPSQAASVGQWDADPWALSTPGGMVDLRTGNLRPADPLAYCTKSTAVVPAPPGTTAPIWQGFLERIFRHDPELIGFMRRVLGYGLTGLTIEHVLMFAWGQGANGKGTLFNTASRLLGDYAAVAPADLLLVTHGDRHPTDMAMLRGARFVTAQELAPGRAWDEPKLKSLTGGDPITARYMRQDFFTYEPQFLLVAAGNHKPSFKGVDEAIRRRVNLVPFLQNVPGRGARQGAARKAEGRMAGDPALDDRWVPGVAEGGTEPAQVGARGQRGLPRR